MNSLINLNQRLATTSISCPLQNPKPNSKTLIPLSASISCKLRLSVSSFSFSSNGPVLRPFSVCCSRFDRPRASSSNDAQSIANGSDEMREPSFLEFITSERVKVVAMLALALALCNADRVVMSVAIVPLSHSRGWRHSFAGVVQDFYVMEDNISVATLVDSTASKIQQLQKAFAELESHRAITLNLKWKQLEEHFNGLQKSLKRRFTELEEQEKEFETKIIDSREMLEKRKAAVVAKEQDSLERLQEKRNAAISAILTAMENSGKPFSVDPGVTSGENPAEMTVLDEKKTVAMVTESDLTYTKNPFENMHVQVKFYPELLNLCQQMNSEGLHKFISDNRKNLAILKEEIPIALKAAADPASLVLDSLKGFYDMELPNSDARKDSSLLGLRRTCIMLMECLSRLFVNLDLQPLSGVLSEKVKERAKTIAEEWKQKLDYLDVDANNGNSLEAHGFLQLLATFGINSDFDQEMLSRLIPMVSRRRQTAELCRYLGLSDKMPGVIDVLVRSGRQIDAVNLAFAFELKDQFSPMSLLKSYLSEVKKASSATKPGNVSPSASTQGDVNERELTALKAVIKCIEDHKLEEQFPVNPLQKQVHDIEKAKADKKRATEVAKPQSKRPRANGVGHAPRVSNATTDKNFYSRMTERYPQYIYDRPYAYPGPTDHHIPSFLGTATYNFSHNHGNFFGNAYQYQPAYLH